MRYTVTVRQYSQAIIIPVLRRNWFLLYTQDGVHTIRKTKTHTAEALKLMKTQDLNYINSKRSMETKVMSMKKNIKNV